MAQRPIAVLSLFSFLDILACMIGALIVIIAIILVSPAVPVTRQETSPEQTSLAMLKASVDAKMAETAHLRNLIEERRVLRETLQAKRERWDRAVSASSVATAIQADAVAELEAAAKARLRVLELSRRRDVLLHEVALRVQVANTNTVKVLRDRIEIHFAGSGRGLKPSFVDCASDRLIIHGGTNEEVVIAQNILVSERYRQFLTQVKNTSGGTVIFLVRPSGVSSLLDAEARALEMEVRNGKIPVPGEGVLDFGALDNASREGKVRS